MKTSGLLRANAAFLMVMGGGAAVADAMGHFFGKGPLGAAMFRAPLAISSFEAHLLAFVMGVLLWRGARLPDRKPFHVLAAVVHVILGGSNILFFEGAFGALGMERFGVFITAFHVAFACAQASVALKAPRHPTGSVILQEN